MATFTGMPMFYGTVLMIIIMILPLIRIAFSLKKD